MKKSPAFPAAVFTLALLVISQSGCASNSASIKASKSGAGFVELSGKVVETAEAGGYTYICLEENGKKIWAAAPTMKVEVGEELALMPGAEMSNFNSKSLGRTFEKIIFSGGLLQRKTVPAATGQTVAAAKALEQPVLAGKVAETMNAASYTYIRLEKDGRSSWSAVPSTQVKVGDEIEIIPGTDMGGFTSKSLNKTFDNIHFSAGIKGEKAIKALLPQSHPEL